MRKANLCKIAGLDTINIGGTENNTCVIILHGYGADNKDLASLAHHTPGADKLSWYFPNGILEVPLSPFMMGRAWFPIDMAAYEKAMAEKTFRDFSKKRPGGFDEAMNKVNELYFNLQEKYDKIIVGGFSQGAMIATELALKNDDSVSGLAILSGVLVNQSKWEPLMEKAETLSFFQSHGIQDPVLSIEGARDLNALMKKHNHIGDLYDFVGQHEIPVEVIQKLGVFLKNQS
ncbi:MAG: esterase [Bdellovibrionaceae bacterium]|jgi:phospholipase/carboxylesterase|nr:esterase [Pseudobdellovibrionaceae bacterium]